MTQIFASVIEGVVDRLESVPDGLTPGVDLFTPGYAASLIAVPAAMSGQVAPGWRWDNGAFAAPAAAQHSIADLLDYAAAVRWRIETGGIVVAGSRIDTSRDSQSMIANANAYAIASGVAQVSYKASSGWVVLPADEIRAIALAVGAHVQGCFDAERALDSAIAATPPTVTSFGAIDGWEWPKNA